MGGNEINIHAIPALSDNYIWALRRDEAVLIVDPGDDKPVTDYLEANNLRLQAILITHKHADHIGGVAKLTSIYPDIEVIAPSGEGNEHATKMVSANDTFTPANWPASFGVHATPGHTSGHLTYVGEGAALCGDALFSCGCGRLFEGDENDLAASMEVFKNLDGNLLVCCGHEYTAANIAFARAVEPDNENLQAWEATVEGLLEDGKPTLPVTLEHERKVNPFLRASVPAIRQAAQAHCGRELETTAQVLGALRAWKDDF